MRILFVLLLVCTAVACTKPNSEFCCQTPEQCASFGVDELRPCRAGQACSAGTCVAKECDTSADCTTPEASVCIDNLCEASCRTDADCAGLPDRPFCASDGVCVGCIDASQCSGDNNICDAEDRACRGCEADAECSGGVCLEADAKCIADAGVIFVGSGLDVGECTRNMPCGTIGYALTKISPSRTAIHIDGGSTSVGTTTVNIDLSVYIDGTGTMILGGGAASVFNITQPRFVTFSGVTIAPTSQTVKAIVAGNGAQLRLFEAAIGTLVQGTGATLDVERSRFNGVNFGAQHGLDCSSGTVSITNSEFVDSEISAVNCQVTVKRNRFDNLVGSYGSNAGLITIENNLFVTRDGISDCMGVITPAPGSSVRFNTYVNTTSVPSDGVAIACDPGTEVTSNIFAYSSMHPFLNGCRARYSLFDNVAVADQTTGEGNVVADPATFFINRTSRDFRLAAQSPARQAAERNLPVTEDIDGGARPNPVGSAPDMGAVNDRCSVAVAC